jgi:hypothetical protein
MSEAISKTIWFAAAFAFTVAIVALLRMLQHRRAHARDGWRHLTPGPMMWFALICNLLVGGVLLYMYLFVGSRRWDADQQMVVLRYLTAAFNALSLLLAYSMIAEEVRWNEKRIERRTLFLRRRGMSWHQLAAMGREYEYWWVSAFDGPRIRFSLYSNGVSELLAEIRRHLPLDEPPTANVTAARPVFVRRSNSA